MSDFLKRIADFSPRRLQLLAAELEERNRAVESRNQALEARNSSPIAIVGIGCRFPGGVRDADTYWQLLRDGRDAITDVPKWRWNADQLFDPDPHAIGKVASKWGGFLDSPETFDAAFFGIAPVEAMGMDPQQRLLLEVSWEALENAAIAPSGLNGSRTGVYVGLCNSDYAQRALQQTGPGAGQAINAYFAQGASHAVASGRISYFLGLRGPSVSIDTACSSSLVAIHQACQSLRVCEIDMALAGGVNLLFNPQVTMALSRAQMMAGDGRCKAFSAAADGFVRSEGCGVLVLKRLDDAQRNCDRIIAIIRGTAVNQDGRSSGITAPNGPSQEDVIRAALADGKVDPQSIGYVEAHGTGTSLGDPIELRALEAVLGKGRPDNQRLPVGSVKSNFGHAESAAGVAGLIKLALSLSHGEIPASLHFSSPNPAVDWENNHLHIPVGHEPWPTGTGMRAVRLGSVSSFGFSGTNAHMILEQGPLPTSSRADRGASRPAEFGVQVITLSARTANAFKATAAQLSESLRRGPGLSLNDVAYTLATGRSSFAHRAAIRADTAEQLIEDLDEIASSDAPDSGRFSMGFAEGRAPRVAFLFAGQGGEHTGMGLSLLEHSEVFRAAVAEVDSALVGISSAPIEKIFRNEHDELSDSSLVQPALFAFQYGLARLWQSWGVEPHILIGHSMGEIVAATIAQVLSVKQAAYLVAARGRLTGALSDAGGMVAVAAAETEVKAAIQPYANHVSIAAINGRSNVVISGRSKPLERVTQELEAAGVRVKRLNITYGSHSPAMDRVLPAFRLEAEKLDYSDPRIPILADLTGDKIAEAGFFNADYFTKHLRLPIQFDRCLQTLAKEDCGLCIEMGPRAVLTTYGKQRTESRSRWVASATGRESDFKALQSALGEAFAAGALIHWGRVFKEATLGRSKPAKIALPTYPFERERYWIEDAASSSNSEATPATSFALSHLPGRRLDTASPTFETLLQNPLPLDLDQHTVAGRVVLPASFYISMISMGAALSDLPGSKKPRINNLEILAPVPTGYDKLQMQTSFYRHPDEKGHDDRQYLCQISSRSIGRQQWELNAKAEIETTPAIPLCPEPSSFNRDGALRTSGGDFYDKLESRSIHLGKAFRGVQELWFRPGSALGRIVLHHPGNNHDEQLSSSPGLRPAVLDACFQVLGGAALTESDFRLRLISNIAAIEWHQPLTGEMWVTAQLETSDKGVLRGRVDVRDAEGSLLLTASGIELKPVAADAISVHQNADWIYRQSWQPMELKRPAVAHRERRHWLILGDHQGIAGELTANLVQAGETAEAWDLISGDNAKLVLITKCDIVDLRCLDDQADKPTNSGEACSCDSGTANKANLIGRAAARLVSDNVSLWKHATRNDARLWIFTAGSQSLRPVSLTGAVQSQLWGLARCATLEHPQTLQRIVDLDPAAGRCDWLASVQEELLTADDEEQLAYLGSERRALRLQKVDESSLELASEAKTVINKHGSYLLTGGLGGLGIRVARWLVEKGATNLVLMTRSQASIKAREGDLEELRQSGARLTIVVADVADSLAVERIFARFSEHGDLSPLRGIFHLAADIRAHAVRDISIDDVHAALQSKVNGTWNLHQLSLAHPIDFFVAFSSTASILGSGRLGAYAAANSFLDAMGSLRAAETLPFLSVNWGTWQTMRQADRHSQESYSSGGMLPMTDEMALIYLDHLISQTDLRSAIIANIDWSLLKPLYEVKRSRRWLEEIISRQPASGLNPGLKIAIDPGETRLAALERAARKEAARVLGYRGAELPASNVRLSELGLDSLMAVNLRNRLQTLIGHPLPATFAFEHPTPAQMALALDMSLWSSGIVDEAVGSTDRDEIQI